MLPCILWIYSKKISQLNHQNKNFNKMKNGLLFSFLVISSITLNAQVYFGIYAKNKSKKIELVDCIFSGYLSQKELGVVKLEVPVYSVKLSPDSSAEIGVGKYMHNASLEYPLTVNTADDSVSSYVVLRNLGKAADSVIVTQIIGIDGPRYSQKVFIKSHDTAMIYLVNQTYIFDRPLTDINNQHYPAITVLIE